MADNAAIAKSFFEAWNERDFERGAALAAEDAEIVEVPTGEKFRGPNGLRQEYEKWATGLPDGKVEIRNVVAGDGWVTLECVVRGTHTGPFATPAGEIPPTGRIVELPFSTFEQIQNGKLARARHYYDTATMMRQLGLMPEASVGATV